MLTPTDRAPLRKAIETGSGAHASYWRIQGVRISISGYVDEALRRAGKEPLANAHIDIPAEELAALLPALYERLLGTEAFKDAVSVRTFEEAPPAKKRKPGV